jgi:hypothetical protein
MKEAASSLAVRESIILKNIIHNALQMTSEGGKTIYRSRRVRGQVATCLLARIWCGIGDLVRIRMFQGFG